MFWLYSIEILESSFYKKLPKQHLVPLTVLAVKLAAASHNFILILTNELTFIYCVCLIGSTTNTF